MRFWFKLVKENRTVGHLDLMYPGAETRTQKVFQALEEGCAKLDLPRPVWLDRNVDEFRRVAYTRFRQDNFLETIPFDYMLFQITEEDFPI